MNAVYVFDFTIAHEDGTTPDTIKTWCKDIAKKWGFQLERGEDSGYQHYQGRLKLHTKLRLKQFAKQLPGKGHLSITSDGNKSGPAFYSYVTKDATRVSGPWTDKDEELYIPRQIREIESLRQWQQSIVDGLGKWEPRFINVLVDRRGNIGKSVLVGYCRAHGLARKLSYCNDFKDIMRMVCDMPTATAYFIDMPRAVNKDRLFQLYAAIEEIKNGFAWDDRYHYREKNFDSPVIWVFTNTPPDLNLCSRDRWKIWTVENETLKALAL